MLKNSVPLDFKGPHEWLCRAGYGFDFDVCVMNRRRQPTLQLPDKHKEQWEPELISAARWRTHICVLLSEK